MSIVLVTGTSTAVGKTVATAALVATDLAADRRVGVVKPVQTGAAGAEPSDASTVARLSGCRDCIELVRLDDPLAPDTAARLRQVDIPAVDALAAEVAGFAAGFERTYVEGAGGVKVRLDTSGGTVLTLGQHLAGLGHEVRVVVVTGLALGTLNHTELTVEAIRAAGLEPAGMVLGVVPAELGLAERCNLDELPRITGLRILGGIPAGAGQLRPADFRRAARGWLQPDVQRAGPGRYS